jgi:hypothetical protein
MRARAAFYFFLTITVVFSASVQAKQLFNLTFVTVNAPAGMDVTLDGYTDQEFDEFPYLNIENNGLNFTITGIDYADPILTDVSFLNIYLPTGEATDVELSSNTFSNGRYDLTIVTTQGDINVTLDMVIWTTGGGGFSLEPGEPMSWIPIVALISTVILFLYFYNVYRERVAEEEKE